ncbi:MAG: hypothetical protein O9327_05865 [Polaromonas sp.]|nr:hypothetical protein [Polaromonas sp.]
MAPTFSVRNCIKAEDRVFLANPGVADVVERIERALEEPLRSSADTFEMPHSVIEDCGLNEISQALFILGYRVEFAARSKDGQVHTRGDFTQLLRESALEVKSGKQPVAGEAVVFMLAHLDAIRLATHQVVEVASLGAPDNVQRRRPKP